MKEIDWDKLVEEYGIEEEEVDPYNYVVGMDPGGTTGIAVLRYTADTYPELIYLTQLPFGHEGFYEWFVGTRKADNTAIASEVWEEHNKKGVDREPIYVQGVQYAFWQRDITYQSPKLKSLVTDEFLKENNLWTPGRPHQMDALRHAIIWLRNEDEHEKTIESLAGKNLPEHPWAEPGEADEKTIPQPGDGGGDGEPGDEWESAEEAFKRVAEGASKAEAAMAKFSKYADDDGEGTGPGYNESVDNIDYDEVEPEGTRKKRLRDGVFAGYETDTEGRETVLFDEDVK